MIQGEKKTSLKTDVRVEGKALCKYIKKRAYAACCVRTASPKYANLYMKSPKATEQHFKYSR